MADPTEEQDGYRSEDLDPVNCGGLGPEEVQRRLASLRRRFQRMREYEATIAQQKKDLAEARARAEQDDHQWAWTGQRWPLVVSGSISRPTPSLLPGLVHTEAQAAAANLNRPFTLPQTVAEQLRHILAGIFWIFWTSL